MTTSELANGLRERQYKLELYPREQVSKLKDIEIIQFYTVCSCCKTSFPPQDELKKTIKKVKTVEEFLESTIPPLH